MKLIHKLTVLSLTIALVSFALPSNLYAQDGLALEEITVTARKREESLQDAPYTITALTSQDIEVKAINELQDIGSYSPGFFYSENAVGKNSRESRRLIFRGMNPRTDLMHRQAASVFIDGAPSIGPEFGAIESIERIEILKGPQGAHFGRSTYTGALNIITKDPSDEFSGSISFEAAEYGTNRTAVVLEGPLGDNLGYRLTTSTYDTDGQYDNAAVTGQKLGARSTDDFALTLAFNPNDNLSIKLRYHSWEDDDGPDAATALDYRSGYTNCQPGALVGRQDGMSFPTVPLDYVCGKVPAIADAQIGMDTGSTRALALMNSHLNGTPDGLLFPLANGLRNVPDMVAPDHFGLEREAQEISLSLNNDFDNGMNLNIIYAAHENSYGSHNDLDRRVTEGLEQTVQGGAIWGMFWLNHPTDAQDLRMQSMEDSSWEVRLSSSDDQRLRWTVGYSDIEMDNLSHIIGSMFGYTIPVNVPDGVTICNWAPCGAYGHQTSNSDNTQWATISTSAFYGSLTYDFTDQLSISVEARRQKDDVYEGSNNYSPTYGASHRGWDSTEVRNAGGEFTSTMPRIIADYKPDEDTTIYLSYAEGTLPGLFNPSLVGLSESQLAEIAAQTGGADIEVDEEVAENLEFGIKKTILDGRGFISAALYSTDLTNVHIPSVAYYTVDGVQQLTGNVTSQGGDAELSGVEVEGTVLMNENITLGFTYAINDSELGSNFSSGDANDILGDATAAVGNEFSRYPKNSGSLSLDYAKEIDADKTRFARMDYIYTGKMYASNAMVAHTGTGAKVNLRTGLETDKYRLEAYCTNCFNDKQPKGLQAMWDLSGISGAMGGIGYGTGGVDTAAGPRVLTVSLADKRVIGIRASYKF